MFDLGTFDNLGFETAVTGVTSAIGSSAGLATVSGVGASTATAAGTSAGAATVTSVGTAVQPSVGSSAGAATVTGVGLPVNATTGSTAGSSTAQAYYVPLQIVSSKMINFPVDCALGGKAQFAGVRNDNDIRPMNVKIRPRMRRAG